MENRNIKLVSSTLVTFSVIYTTFKFLCWVEEKYYDRKFRREKYFDRKLCMEMENKSNDTIELDDISNNTIENSK